MKKIKLIRENDYANRLLTISIFVNQKEYKLKSNSLIELESDLENIEVYAKLFWLKSKKIVIDDNLNNLKISSIATDSRLIIVSVLLLFFLMLSSIYGGFFNIVFKLIAYTFFLLTILSFTLFSNKYLTIKKIQL